MAISKRRGRWIVDYYLFGKRKTPSFETKAQAEAFWREILLREIDNKVGFKKINTISVTEAIVQYLETISPKKELATQLVDSHALKNFKTVFGDFYVQAIQLQHLEQYQTLLLQKKIKASSVNRKFNVIKHFFRKCAEWKYCVENPALNLSKLKEEIVVRRPLQMGQVDSITEALPIWAARPFYFAAKTGIRRSGICNFTWNSVDFENKSFKIYSKKGGVAKEVHLPMTNDIFAFLLELWNEKIKSKSKVEFVFLNANGNKILPSTLTKKLFSIRKKSGVENAGMHIARHTILTDLSLSNQSGSIIQKVAGHSSLNTSQKYLHHNNKDVRQALEQLEYDKPLQVPLKIVSHGS